MKVEGIKEGQLDAAEARVETVYSKVSPFYAVYRTKMRVMVQFADEGVSSANGQPLGSEQRQVMSELAPLRGEINGLVDGWRESPHHSHNAKANLFDRRVADALVVALQGNRAHAAALLATARDDILEERMAVARIWYMAASGLAALVVIVLMAVLGGSWYQNSLYAFSSATTVLWFGAGVGALGALFSIALGIRDRKIGTDLQKSDNRIDAWLRIFIGAVSAAVLFALLMSDVVTITLGDTNLAPAEERQVMVAGQQMMLWVLSQPLAIILAFAAGFSERLASNLLNRTVIAALEKAGDSGAGGAAGRMVSGPSPSSPPNLPGETDPMGRAASPTPPPAPVRKPEPDAVDVAAQDDVDDCVAELPISDEEITRDIELPEAMGGVEDPPPPPPPPAGPKA